MKRVLAIVLSAAVVVSAVVDIKDLTKVALLINHYHQAHEQISLADFIELHYGASASAHDKEHGHKSLPFKSHERALTQPLTAAPVFVFVPSAESIEPAPLVCRYRTVSLSEFPESIWQPPRLG